MPTKFVVPETLHGDNIRLKQVLINLVKNALKFTRNGLVRIFSTFDEEVGLLKTEVIDNGTGIRKEDMDKLFLQFGKLKRTAEMNSEGIGMGLMICQNLVHSCGGTITVHSDG